MTAGLGLCRKAVSESGSATPPDFSILRNSGGFGFLNGDKHVSWQRSHSSSEELRYGERCRSENSEADEPENPVGMKGQQGPIFHIIL